ncbi:hypothetical protein CU044_3943 [Streptomyces sp. L-9-10]|nr:hypothetical protein CU044_3943 [Streptomyces sp. L-9-10]
MPAAPYAVISALIRAELADTKPHQPHSALSADFPTGH